MVSNNISEINLNFSKAAWHPSLSGSVRQNFNWSNQPTSIAGATVFEGKNGTNISLSSGMTIYNGNKIRNAVKKSETDYEASKYNTEVIKENVSLSVLERISAGFVFRGTGQE